MNENSLLLFNPTDPDTLQNLLNELTTQESDLFNNDLTLINSNNTLVSSNVYDFGTVNNNYNGSTYCNGDELAAAAFTQQTVANNNQAAEGIDEIGDYYNTGKIFEDFQFDLNDSTTLGSTSRTSHEFFEQFHEDIKSKSKLSNLSNSISNIFKNNNIKINRKSINPLSTQKNLDSSSSASSLVEEQQQNDPDYAALFADLNTKKQKKSAISFKKNNELSSQLPVLPEFQQLENLQMQPENQLQPVPEISQMPTLPQIPQHEPARRGRKPSLVFDASKTFVCHYCQRRFKRQEHLKRHFRSLHTNEKPFDCTLCGKKFSRSDNLAQHIKTHSE